MAESISCADATPRRTEEISLAALLHSSDATTRHCSQQTAWRGCSQKRTPWQRLPRTTALFGNLRLRVAVTKRYALVVSNSLARVILSRLEIFAQERVDRSEPFGVH